MAEEEAKKEAPFGFTPEGETFGYISVEQARVLAMQLARTNPARRHWFNRFFKGRRMVFAVAEEKEDGDYYTVTLSFRPEGDIEGTPGQERFIFEKTGEVVLRGVEAWPRRTEQPGLQDPKVMGYPVSKRKRRFPVKRAVFGLGVIAVGAAAVVVVIGVIRAGEDIDWPEVPSPPFVPSSTRTPTSAPKVPTATLAPSRTLTPTPTFALDEQATQEPTSPPRSAPAIGNTPGDTPGPTATPELTPIAEPTVTIGPSPEPTPAPPPTLEAEITNVSFIGALGYTQSLKVASIPGADSHVERAVRVTGPDDVVTEGTVLFTQTASGDYSGAVIVARERIPDDEKDKLAWARENIDVVILPEPEAGP